jgi:glycosyltransferase involved in cell wall biosynthesis
MRILFVSGIGGDTRRYRCSHHQQQLALRGIDSGLYEANDPQLYVEVTVCNLVVLHRVPWSPLIADVVDVARGRGVPIVFETDDLIFAPEVFHRIAYLDTLPPDQAQRFRADLAGQVQTFAHSDCVLTTTEYLAEAAIERGKPAYVQRNACSAEMVAAAEGAYTLRLQRLAQQAAQRAAGVQTPVVIGYFSGSGSHNRDFATVTPVLAALMERYPQLWLHVSGQLDVGGPLLRYWDRIRRAPYVAWQGLPNLVAQIDINLAPLELDNPFCQSKSEIKFTEAALVGVPTVASPTQAFVYAVRDGEDGLLAEGAAQWGAALVRLIEDPEERVRLGEAARRHVYESYLPETAAAALVATLHTILERHAPPSRDPHELLQTLAQAMLRHLERGRDEKVLLARQLDALRDAQAQWEGTSGGQGAAFWRAELQARQQQQQIVLRNILARLEQERAGRSSQGGEQG